jgi:hypothetical protein
VAGEAVSQAGCEIATPAYVDVRRNDSVQRLRVVKAITFMRSRW